MISSNEFLGAFLLHNWNNFDAPSFNRVFLLPRSLQFKYGGFVFGIPYSRAANLVYLRYTVA